MRFEVFKYPSLNLNSKKYKYYITMFLCTFCKSLFDFNHVYEYHDFKKNIDVHYWL